MIKFSFQINDFKKKYFYKKTILLNISKSIRLDKFLFSILQENNIFYSRNFLKQLIINGKVLINNMICLPKNILKNKETISIDFLRKNEKTITIQRNDIKIIFENKNILVIDKPKNLVIHPGIKNTNNTLWDYLFFYKKIPLTFRNVFRMGIIHRLDKQTTGLLIVAKNQNSFNYWKKKFIEKKVKKEYLLLTNGKIKENKGEINLEIGKLQVFNKKFFTKKTTQKNLIKKKEAITYFKVIKKFSNHSLVKCWIWSGKTHQIRVHFQSIGFPILNDPLYEKKKTSSKNIKKNDNLGQYLHASKITVIEKQKKLVTFKSDLPVFFLKKILTLI